MKYKHLITALLLCLSLTACVEHEEVDFEGIIVGARNCTSVAFEQNMGYVVQLIYPEGVGGTMTSSDGQEMSNLVVLYDPGLRLMVHDHIHGSFYWDEKYSRAYCNYHWDVDLPEGVFLDVIVD